MKGTKTLFLTLVVIFSICSISASVVCSSNSIILNYNYTEVPSGDITITSCDSTNSTSISLTGTGVTTYIQKGSDMTSISGTKSMRIQISSNIPIGQYPISIGFGDGSDPISILVNIKEKIVVSTSPILVFPTSKVVTVKQGEEKTQNILITVPSTYSGGINIQSIDFNPGTETILFGDLSLGEVYSGQSIQIPIIFSGVDASTGTYQTTLNIFATNSSGQVSLPSVSLQLQVTAGITPVSNFSLDTLPVCSLSATELNLNSTYAFTCTRSNSNIDIRPVVDDFYIQGVSVEETSSQYIYNFKALKIGNTQIKAEFLYKNAVIGVPFQQDVKISYSGNTPVSGTTLDLDFYQSGAKTSLGSLKSGDTIIQVLDNQTRSLVSSYILYLGGVQVNNTLNLSINTNYELRATAPGYLDRTINFSVSMIPITISISPDKSEYSAGETITITTNPENSSLLLDNEIVSYSIVLNKAGNLTLKAVKEGYVTSEKYIFVKSQVSVTLCSPKADDWKKGKNVICELTNDSSWNVEFKEYSNGGYLDPVSIASGSGDKITFKTEKEGIYNLKTGEITILSKSVENNSFIKKAWNWLGYWWLVIIGLIGIFCFIIFKGKKKESSSSLVSFAQPQG